MKIKFNSELFIKNKRENLLAKVFGVLIGALIIIPTIIEIFTGNFSILHLLLILSAIVIVVAWNLIGCKIIQCSTLGEIEFEPDKMTITYRNIDSGKNVKLYSKATTIQYNEIKNIEYEKELYSFKIEANCSTKHTYTQAKKENPVSNTKKENEIFIYIMEPDVASNILNNLEKYTGINVKISE